MKSSLPFRGLSAPSSGRSCARSSPTRHTASPTAGTGRTRCAGSGTAPRTARSGMPRSPWPGTGPTAGGRTRGAAAVHPPGHDRRLVGPRRPGRRRPVGPSCCTTATRSPHSCGNGPSRRPVAAALGHPQPADLQGADRHPAAGPTASSRISRTLVLDPQAIGWRCASTRAPTRSGCRQAVAGYGDRLSGLSRREALKHTSELRRCRRAGAVMARDAGAGAGGPAGR